MADQKRHSNDNDVSEQPVREKLKKTSIASIPVDEVGCGAAESVREPDHQAEEAVRAELAQNGHTSHQPLPHDFANRGRAFGKRLREESDVSDLSKEIPEAPSTPSSGGHIRKRSRDVKPGKPVRPSDRLKSPVPSLREEEEDEDAAMPTELSNGSYEKDHSPTPKTTLTPPKPTADQEMSSSILSPKKKRSREDFESELSREQKIAATDENRSKRRSSEEAVEAAESANIVEDTETFVVKPTAPVRAVNNMPEASVASAQWNALATKPQPSDSFGNATTTSPFGSLSGSRPQQKLTSFAKPEEKKETETSDTAFQASGFAALAKQNAESGASSKTQNFMSGFGSFAAAASPKTLTSFASNTPSTFGPSSGFGGLLGATPFKSSFASPSRTFGGGAKLSTFAAPVGDVKLGQGATLGSKKARTFGAPTQEEDDESDVSDTDQDDDAAQDHGSEATPEIENTPTLMDTGEENEDTIFSGRCKLFVYKTELSNWAERGIGTIKLNVKRVNDDNAADAPFAESNESEVADNPKDSHRTASTDTAATPQTARPTARLIMRADATLKVILNAPIFKGLSFERSGNRTNFFAPSDGKLVLHSLRMGKEENLKMLLGEIEGLKGKM